MFYRGPYEVVSFEEIGTAVSDHPLILVELRLNQAGVPASPSGWLEGIDATGVATGWTLDPNVAAQSIDAHFYVDGPAGVGTGVAAVTANIPRPDVNAATGHPGNHGFRFQIPAQFIDGRPHTLYVYGIDATGDANVLLAGVPRSFTLSTNRSLAINVVSNLRTTTTETITVYATDAATGAPLNGTITSNGGFVGHIGQQITYTHSYQDCDYDRRPPCYWVREPVDFTVTVPGYNAVNFTR